MPYVPSPPSPPGGPQPRAYPPPREVADSPARSREVVVAARHLTVIRGARRHDVVVDPELEVGAMLTDLLPDEPPGSRAELSPGLRWVAHTLTGEELTSGASIVSAGLVDGSVVVVSARAGDAPGRNAAGDPSERTDGPGSRSERHERRSRGGRVTTDRVAVRVAGSCAPVLSLFALVVVGLPRAGVPPLGAAVLALAIAASMSRVVPDLVLRLPVAAGSTGPGAGGASSHDTAAVHRWVRVVARRQLGAHLAVLVVVLVAGGVLLAATAGMSLALPVGPRLPGAAAALGPVSTPVGLPVLVSVLASATALAGSARGRGRGDRWALRVASASAVIPALVVPVASLPTPVAVLAAYVVVGVGLMGVSPARRRRRPRRDRSRLARGVEVLVVVAVLPVACWAAGLLTVLRAWTP